MLTRRQLLVSSTVLGMPMATALALPDVSRKGLRLGLLQSREPFMDPQDIAGSRERAFSSYGVLIRRSFDEHPSLDWLAGAAFPLSGPGPFTRPALEQIALTESCAELKSLALLAKARRLKLTLGAWWKASDTSVVPRLLTFDSSGRWRVLPRTENRAFENLQLHLPAGCGSPSLAGFAEQCRQLNRYGARIEMLRGPTAPPGVRSATGTGSAVISPEGQLLAQADQSDECCLEAEVW